MTQGTCGLCSPTARKKGLLPAASGFMRFSAESVTMPSWNSLSGASEICLWKPMAWK